MRFELKTKRIASPSKSWNDCVVDARRGIERPKEVPEATKRCGMVSLHLLIRRTLGPSNLQS